MKCLLLLSAILMCSTSGFGQKQVSFRDSVFLEIKGILADPAQMDSLIHSNMGTYVRAFNRFQETVSVKNNRVVWSIKNGAEINISENIYDYFVWFFTFNNEENLPSGEYEIRKSKEDGFYYVMMKKVPMDGYRRLTKKERRGTQ